MQTIADDVGVSRNAVSLALRNHPSISEQTKKLIEASAKKLGYHRNPTYGELMSQMRMRGLGKTAATIALFNANKSNDAFKNHPTIPEYVKGCQKRSTLLGYPLDYFWLHQPNTPSSRWIDILEARGIRGIIIIGLMKNNQLPKELLPIFEHFPTIVTGVRTRTPSLPFTCVDHHILSLRAIEKAISLGYKRPGLIIDSTIDELVDHRFSAGYFTGQQKLPKTRQLNPFFEADQANEDISLFKTWLKKEKPDVILTLYDYVQDWLTKLGYKIPSDIGLIQLEKRKNKPDWAGMNQHNDITGEAAIDMVISRIHHGEPGIPQFPQATLIGPTWEDGKTVRRQ
ncbi:LacI family DNA-binding transcriptional regulator [Verrucomicrobiaceae bacterium N1E253]|uniref:LacI family DNA-binding transcriptional regulator n=2 Tax=Oceaniferula marina TaxID=2748318 RepID=A0A851GLH9_9BACT|nr:LacI family DNA-binding transcriptional regulator [Oceaniferula marina]